MSITLRRPGRTHLSRVSALALVAGLLAGLTPVAVPGTALAAAPRDTSAGGLAPTVQYQDAMAHANDKIAFAPGERVTVPFRPHAGDAWRVDGRAPRRVAGRPAVRRGDAQRREPTEARSGASAGRAGPDVGADRHPQRQPGSITARIPGAGSVRQP